MKGTNESQMELRELHPDMERYLEEDCYCPGEIYDVTGFFFQTFKGEEKCQYVGEGKSKDPDRDAIIKCVICRNQLLNFWIDVVRNQVYNAERYDATENNIKFMQKFLADAPRDGMVLDEFEKGSTVKALEDVLRYADAIIVS